MDVNKLIKTIQKLDLTGYGQDFLLTWDKSGDELEATLLLAEVLRENHRRERSNRVFDAGLAVSIFSGQFYPDTLQFCLGS